MPRDPTAVPDDVDLAAAEILLSGPPSAPPGQAEDPPPPPEPEVPRPPPDPPAFYWTNGGVRRAEAAGLLVPGLLLFAIPLGRAMLGDERPFASRSELTRVVIVSAGVLCFFAACVAWLSSYAGSQVEESSTSTRTTDYRCGACAAAWRWCELPAFGGYYRCPSCRRAARVGWDQGVGWEPLGWLGCLGACGVIVLLVRAYLAGLDLIFGS